MRNTFGLLAFSAVAVASLLTSTLTAQQGPQQAVKNVNKRNLNASLSSLGAGACGKLTTESDTGPLHPSLYALFVCAIDF